MNEKAQGSRQGNKTARRVRHSETSDLESSSVNRGESTECIIKAIIFPSAQGQYDEAIAEDNLT